MATFADLFKTCYLTGGRDVEFAKVRLHFRGADEVCRGFGATALTIGSDIFFRDGAFAPHAPAGLRILAHEVAHVVQQHRGPVAARPVAGGLAVAPAGSAEEREAEAAADALLSGRPFAFAGARSAAGAPGTGRRVVQRYTAWEHCMLGDLDPALLPETQAGIGPEHLEAQCALLERLGGDPRNVDEERLRAEHPGHQTLRGPSRTCWPTGKPASPAGRSSKAFPITWNRAARSSPCGSGTTAPCGTCASANCSACGAPPR